LGLKVPPNYERARRRAEVSGRMIKAPDGMSFPSSFDWRSQGGVTPVRDQGNCGSCWAFAATAALESRILIYSGLELDLSEQAVIACNQAGDDCGGGWMSTAYDLFISGGAMLEECMPYHMKDAEACIPCEPVDSPGGYYYVGDSVADLKAALLGGPVAVAMTSCGALRYYTGGAFEETCTGGVNHAVLLVGWDDEACGGEGAWIAKNSWGPDWGESGFLRIRYGACNIGYGAEALTYSPPQTVHFFLGGRSWADVSGDGDGFIENGETASLAVSILNVGVAPATGVNARLDCLTPGVVVTDDETGLPQVPPGEVRTTESPHFEFRVLSDGPAAGPLEFHVTVVSDQGRSGFNLTLQAGEVVEVFADDFETDRGWTVGDAGDGAVTGTWERGVPEGTWWGDQPVQPEGGRTGDGCFATGLSAGTNQGTHDVDGGRTTLTSPVIDLSSLGSARLSYYRWYASDTGPNPNEDDFTVQVSADGGGTWQTVEDLSFSDRRWRERVVFLEEHVALTDRVRLRFVARDGGVGGSIVEACVDDVVIEGSPAGPPAGTGPGPDGSPAGAELRIAGGNPVSGPSRLVFGLPRAGRVRLGLYDVRGRLVDLLLDEDRPRGYHLVQYNGRGRSGARLGAGVYFLRLDTPAGPASVKLVLTR
jgi:hypothetical protein